MNSKTLVYILIFIFLGLWSPSTLQGAISTHDSTPTTVEISGLLPDSATDGLVTKNMVIELCAGSENVVVHSFSYDVQFVDTSLVDMVSFRVLLDLLPVLDELVHFDSYFFRLRLPDAEEIVSGKLQPVSLNSEDGIESKYVNLPVGVVPMAMKSHFVPKSNQMYDDQLLFVDDTVGYVGVRNKNPKYPLDVNGSVYVSKYYHGDGSGLVQLPSSDHGDYYYKLLSKDLEHTVMEVDAFGKVYIGATQHVVPTADMMVFGSLLLESNSDVVKSTQYPSVSTMWFWDSVQQALRVGSINDKDFGYRSVGFGYHPSARSEYSMVFGGKNNTVLAPYSIVAGGESNQVDQSWSVIVGGKDNRIASSNLYLSSESSVILGGAGNQSIGSSIILGGQDNIAFGTRNVVAGKENIVDTDRAIVLGGESNIVSSPNSQAYGSYIDINHSNTIVFNAQTNTDRVQSNASDHIQFNTSHGMGINTSDTVPNRLRVSGNVRATKLVGSARGIVNIRAVSELWSTTNASDELIYSGSVGVGTRNTLESLTIDGSIRLRDNAIFDSAVPVPGTIKYEHVTGSDAGDFYVFSNGEWVSLTLDDTNTEYKAIKNMVLDTTTNTFYIVTENAKAGYVMMYDPDKGFFAPRALDRFVDVPLETNINGVQRKRVMLPADIKVGVGTKPSYPLDVYLSNNAQHMGKKILGYFFHPVNSSVDRYTSFSLAPTEIVMNFQEYATPVGDGGSGLKVIDVNGKKELQFYVNDGSVKKNTMILTPDKVRINSLVSDSDFPFYVDGDVRVGGLVFSGDGTDSVLLKDSSNTVFLQSDKSGDLTLSAVENILFKYKPSGSFFHTKLVYGQKDGIPAFGVRGDNNLRGVLDVSAGNIHVGENISFYNSSLESKSSISFIQSDPIAFVMNDNDRYVSVRANGNISFYGNTTDDSDVLIKQSGKKSNVTILESGVLNKQPTLVFKNQGNPPSFNIVMESNVLQFKMGNIPNMTVAQSGFIGLHTSASLYPLSIGVPVTLKEQISIGQSTNKMNGSSAVFAIESDNNVVFSTDTVPNAIVVKGSSVFINSDLNTEPSGATFYVNGTMLVTGNVLDKDGYKVFPLSVKPIGGEYSSTINTIVVDESSGLTVDVSSSKAVVGYPGFVDTIKVGDKTMGADNVDSFTIRAGKGMKLEPSGKTIILKDKMQLSGENLEINMGLTINGDVNADAFTGDASGIINIPFRWASANNKISTLENIGIGADSVGNYKLKVEGDVSADKLIATNVAGNRIYSPDNLDIDVSNVAFATSVSFFNNTTLRSKIGLYQWGIGPNDPTYTLDVNTSAGGATIQSSSSDYKIQFKVQESSFLTLRQESDRVLLNPNKPFLVDVHNDSNYELYVDSLTNKIGIGINNESNLTKLDGIDGVVVKMPLTVGSDSGKFNTDSSFNVDLNGLNLIVGDMPVPVKQAAMMVFGSVVLGENTLNNRVYNAGAMYVAPDLRMHVGGIAPNYLTEPADLYVNGGLYAHQRLQVSDTLFTGDGNTAFMASSQDRDFKFWGKTGVLVSANAHYLFVDSNNNVGLDTTSPQAGLHVKDASGMANIKLEKDDSKLTFKKTSTKEAVIERSVDVVDVRFHTGSAGDNNSTGLHVLSAGDKDKIGVNKVPEPSGKVLQVSGTVNAEAYIVQDKFATNLNIANSKEYSKGGYASFGTVPIGTIIIWTKPNAIPAGWEPVAELNGKFLKGATSNQTVLDSCSASNPQEGCVGYNGGSNSVNTNAVKHGHGAAGHADHILTEKAGAAHNHSLPSIHESYWSYDSENTSWNRIYGWNTTSGITSTDSGRPFTQTVYKLKQTDIDNYKIFAALMARSKYLDKNKHLRTEFCEHVGIDADSGSDSQFNSDSEPSSAYDSNPDSIAASCDDAATAGTYDPPYDDRGSNGYHLDDGAHSHETTKHKHDFTAESMSNFNSPHTVTENIHAHSAGAEHAHTIDNKPHNSNPVIFIKYVGGG
jgi:hypothetical protein